MEDGGGGGLWGRTDGALIVWCDKVRLSGLSIGRISGRADMRVSRAECTGRRVNNRRLASGTIAQACKNMLNIRINNK